MQPPASSDRGLEAFRRLLSQAHQSEEARIDAIVALSQRQFIVPALTSGGGQDNGIAGFRTVVTDEGLEALPLFTDAWTLSKCAEDRGWQTLYDPACMREMAAREALQWAHANHVDYVVVDLGMPYCIEIKRQEFEPVLTPFRDVESAGPYAASGALSEELADAIRMHASPASVQPRQRRQTVRVFENPLSLGERRSSLPGLAHRHPRDLPEPNQSSVVPVGIWSSGPAAAPGRSLTLPLMPAAAAGQSPKTDAASPNGAESGAHEHAAHALRAWDVLAPTHTPSDETFDAWSSLLRSFPQIEWACFGEFNDGLTPTRPAVGLALNPLFEHTLAEIQAEFLESDLGESRAEVISLALPQVAAMAKEHAIVFYPWKP